MSLFAIIEHTCTNLYGTTVSARCLLCPGHIHIVTAVFYLVYGQMPPPRSNVPLWSTLPVSDRESMYNVYYVIDMTWYRSDIVNKT